MRRRDRCDRDQGDEKPSDVHREVFEAQCEQGVWHDQRDGTENGALAQCPRSEPRKRGQNNETSRRTNNATPNRIGTMTKVDTPLVKTARVRTAAEPHPRIAATSGVHGFMRPGRYNPDSG